MSSDILRTRFVLYVENQPVNVLLMEAIFQRRPNYQLVVANDGASGLEAARGFKADLLLLDIGLPDCRGTELLCRIRKLPGWKTVPAVAVTAKHGFDLDGTTFAERWAKPMDIRQALHDLDRLLLTSVPPLARVKPARTPAPVYLARARGPHARILTRVVESIPFAAQHG